MLLILQFIHFFIKVLLFSFYFLFFIFAFTITLEIVQNPDESLCVLEDCILLTSGLDITDIKGEVSRKFDVISKP